MTVFLCHLLLIVQHLSDLSEITEPLIFWLVSLRRCIHLHFLEVKFGKRVDIGL